MRHSSEVSRARPTHPALRALAVSLAAFVTLGLVDGALGVAWPSIRDVFGRDISDLGLLLAFGSAGYLTASAGYGWLHSRLGTGSLLGIGASSLVFGLAGIASFPQWLMVATAAILLGLGGGLVDTGMNAHAALVFDVGSINLLHACYGIGATLGPVVITLSLVSTGAWRGGYAVLAGSQLVVALAVWSRRANWTGAEPDVSGDQPMEARRGQVWLMLVLFFLYTGAEVATGQWAFTLLTEGRGMSTAIAGTWVAVYWGGLTVGRFGFGMVGDRLSPSRALGGSMVVALLGVALIWVDPFGLGAVGLPLAGLGFAAVFPTLVALTPARIGRLRSTRSIGFQLASANIGAAAVPWVLGLMAGVFGVEALAPGLLAVAVLLAVLHFVTDHGDQRGQGAPV
jgi:fucose permease